MSSVCRTGVREWLGICVAPLFLQSNPRRCSGTSPACGFPRVHVLQLTQFFFGASWMFEVGNPEGERKPEMCLCLCKTDGGHFFTEL